MSKRKLKRQLDLGQAVMLGASGTLAAEIFVLTGHVAGIVGPAATSFSLLTRPGVARTLYFARL